MFVRGTTWCNRQSTHVTPMTTANLNMRLPEFLRLFDLRAPRIMWFLGAGASASAGIPTASELIWDFKRKIYCSEQRIHPARVSDLTNRAVQARIQAYLDEKAHFPQVGTENEYAAFFEATYPSPVDRQTFIQQFLTGRVPSYGHFVLAQLMNVDKARVVWTTNFDKLVEDAAARTFVSTSRLTVADLGEPQKADAVLSREQWPLLVKIHGDFHSERLMNTTLELQTQDEQIRHAFGSACQRYGLAVAGYSGRDSSVMEIIEEAIKSGKGFRDGLFWFKREGSIPFPRVNRLISLARENGIEAYFVDVPTFDELLADIARYVPSIDQAFLASLAPQSVHLVPTPLPGPSSTPPFIRTNAIAVTSVPTTCRLIECDIGNYEDVQQALKTAGIEDKTLAFRTKKGVLAFGRDTDLRIAFSPHNLRNLDYYSISPDRFSHSTSELALIYDALGRALSGRVGVTAMKRHRSWFLIPDVAQKSNPLPTHSVVGIVPGTTVGWREAASIRLDCYSGRVWLLVQPTVILDWKDDEDQKAKDTAKDFVREKLATRRNREYNEMLDGWVELIFGKEENVTIYAFGISDGSDAVFELSRTTAYSGRATS